MTYFNQLSCVKHMEDFPASLSLHSVDMLPLEDSDSFKTGLMAVSLRLPNEIRVVHGTSDVHNSLADVINNFNTSESSEDGSSNKSAEDTNEEETILERNGVWVKTVGSQALKTVSNVCSLSCNILQKLITTGWEVLSSSELCVRNGELATWIFKKCATPPLHNAQISCIVLEGDNKIKVIGSKNQIQVNNVIKTAIEKCWSKGILCDNTQVPLTLKTIKQDLKSPELLEEIDMELKASRENLDDIEPEKKTNNHPIKKIAQIRDDPECPDAFELWGSPWRPTNETERIMARILILEITHLLFCRQWKMITNANLIRGSSCNNDVLFLCQDGRILPAIGQQSFAMLEVQKPNIIRMHNIDDEVEKSLRESSGLELTPLKIESEKSIENIVQYSIKDLSSNEDSTQGSKLAMQLVQSMNSNKLNHYGTIHLNRHESDQSCLLIFKQSNVSFSESMCIHLSGYNKIGIVGGSENEIELIRGVLRRRWPYPITRDEFLTNTGTHHFKLKRYPWAISYGNKRVDKAIQTAQNLLPQLVIPPPTNQDTDSGKSIIIFTLKELLSSGWRLITSMDLTGTSGFVPDNTSNNKNPNLDPYSLYFMR